jgi:hypothetical protein
MRFGLALLLVAVGACAQPVVSGRGWMAAAESEVIGVQINAVYASLPPQGGVIRSTTPAPLRRRFAFVRSANRH